MRRLRITMPCLFLLAAGGLLADEPSRPAAPVGAETLAPGAAAADDAAVPLPPQTPFENDPERRNSYRRGYLGGYRRARTPEGQADRMAEPEVSNLAAVRGFVEGWQAGVASLPAGSVPGSLPGQFAPFIRWNGPGGEGMPGIKLLGGARALGEERVERLPRELPAEAWNVIRAARGKANEKGPASEFVGAWTMTLPRNFVYDITIAQREDGLLEMRSSKAGLVLLGAYAVQGDRLQLVEPVGGIDDLSWQFAEGVFTLKSQEVRNGGHYVGTRLERAPKP